MIPKKTTLPGMPWPSGLHLCELEDTQEDVQSILFHNMD